MTVGVALGSTAFYVYSISGSDPVPKKEPVGASWKYDEVFPGWPKDRKPEFVIVITGQTYGYLQKCGCSDPQKGGLERRFNFLQGFKALGIEALPIDLGDVAPPVSEDHKLLHSQALLKYKTAMIAMRTMGYKVVGLGKEEFALDLQQAIGEYSMQKGNESPRVLSANLSGWLAGQQVLTKALAFPDATGKETSVRDWEIIPTAKNIPVGVIGIVGDSLIASIKTLDSKMVFAEPPKTNTAKVIDEALAAMNKQAVKPQVNVLLYSGPLDAARKAADFFPQIQIIVCRSEEAEPPNAPMMVVDPKKNQNTMIIRVGHKGQSVGVVGVFKNEKGALEYHYQRVALTPEYDTLPGDEKGNLALQELENYSKLVRDRGFLTQNRKSPHPLQATNPKATFAGSDSCMQCHKEHDTSWATWAGSKHAQAYAALENIANKPGLRNFDSECIRCHVVGFDHNSGFVSKEKTPLLRNVGCESCHGPGSEHNANPKNKALALELSPWKIDGKGMMPAVAKLTANPPVKLDQQETQIMLRVDRICQTCHNAENDPHFKIEVYWPKIAHLSNPAPKDNGVNPVKGPDTPPPSIGPPMALPK